MLSRLLGHAQADPAFLSLVDSAAASFASSDAAKPTPQQQPGAFAVEQLLLSIGQSAVAPAFAALAANAFGCGSGGKEEDSDAVAALLQKLKLWTGHSTGGVCTWAEQVG